MSKQIQVGAEKEIVFGFTSVADLIIKDSDIDDGAVTINNPFFVKEIKNNGNLEEWKVYFYDTTNKQYFRLFLDNVVDGASTRTFTFKDIKENCIIACELTFATNAVAITATLAD